MIARAERIVLRIDEGENAALLIGLQPDPKEGRDERYRNEPHGDFPKPEPCDEEHAAAFLDRHHMKLFYGSDCNDKDGQGDKCSGSQQLSTVRKLVPDQKMRHAILFGNANRVIFGNHG